MLRVRWAGSLILALAALTFSAPAQAEQLVFKLPHGRPLSDRAAARLVHRSAWEPRPANHKADHTVPTRAQLAYFHAHDSMPLARYVNGDYTGTTDEILQWGARKWGFSPDLFRAVATVESWWTMSLVGNDGTSFGILQIRVPYHCCLPEIADSTAFNVDYYGAFLRGMYGGLDPWLNQVPHGRRYAAGDLWGSIGAWASGRWYLGDSQSYVAHVKQRLAQRTWATDRWF